MNKELHDLVKTIAAKQELELIDVIKLHQAISGKVPIKPMYIVEFLRNGDREAHSYIGGVFSSYLDSLDEAQEHMEARAGKYCTEIHEFYPGSPSSIRLYRRFSLGDQK